MTEERKMRLKGKELFPSTGRERKIIEIEVSDSSVIETDRCLSDSGGYVHYLLIDGRKFFAGGTRERCQGTMNKISISLQKEEMSLDITMGPD